jgi:hypothetical protein
MTRDERIEITKEYIRHLILARKLRVSPIGTDAIRWIGDHWDVQDDAQLSEYRCLWHTVEKEIQDEQRGQ